MTKLSKELAEDILLKVQDFTKQVNKEFSLGKEPHYLHNESYVLEISAKGLKGIFDLTDSESFASWQERFFSSEELKSEVMVSHELRKKKQEVRGKFILYKELIQEGLGRMDEYAKVQHRNYSLGIDFGDAKTSGHREKMTDHQALDEVLSNLECLDFNA